MVDLTYRIDQRVPLGEESSVDSILLGHPGVRRRFAEERDRVTREAAEHPVRIRYRNWKGVESDRTIILLKLWFGSTKWHPAPQWILTAWDVEQSAERHFAMADILAWSLEAPHA